MKEEIISLFRQMLNDNDDNYKKENFLSFIETGFNDLWENQKAEGDEVNLFRKVVAYFVKYSKPIIDLGEKRPTQFANFMLIISFSLVEGLMQGMVEYKDFATFLREKRKNVTKDETCNKGDLLRALEKEYREKYGSSEKVRRFFKKYISVSDKEYIKKSYENGKFKEIDQVINDIYDVRSKFIHSLGFESLLPINKVLEIKGKEVEVVPTLNIKHFVVVVWRGIYKKFDLSG